MKRKLSKPLAMLIALSLCIILYFVYLFHKSEIAEKNNPMQVSLNLPNEYAALFDTAVNHKLKTQSTVSFKLRNVIAYLTYDSKYDLEITKINTNPLFEPNKDIHVSNNPLKATMAESYLPGIKNNLTTNYNPVSSEPISNIYISFSGNSITTISKSTNLVSYYLRVKDMHIQYTPSGVKEFFISSTNKLSMSDTNPSVEIAFLKKDKELYFLLLTPKDNSTISDPDLLNKMLSIK